MTMTRRGFFDRAIDGLHGAALTYLLSKDLFGTSTLRADEPRRVYDSRPRRPHFEPRAKAVIQLFMNGGPSQVDTFDPKPMLERHHGQSYFNRIAADVSSPQAAGGLMRSPFTFARHGQSGIWLSDALPHLAPHVDDIAVIRSMFNSHPNHEPALFKIHSGQLLPGLPALGSWVVYGLGSENQNLPAYIVLDDPLGLPVNGVQELAIGLPAAGLSRHAISRHRCAGAQPAQPDTPQPAEVVHAAGPLVAARSHPSAERPGQLQLDASPAMRWPPACSSRRPTRDFAPRESRDARDVRRWSGADRFVCARCLMARRWSNAACGGVQLFINRSGTTTIAWRARCAPPAPRTDKPVGALLQDLKERGLLQDTLVIWGGEFGRLPIAQFPAGGDYASAGRDHGPRGFSIWMAGGGIKGGTTYGATDEIGYAAAENRVSIADWHATILHLLGLHHEELFFERNGFRDKLTGTFPVRIVNEVLA